MRSLLIVLALLLTACTGPPLAGTPSSPTRTSPTEILPDAQVAESVDDVVHRTPKELSAPRLASGLTPPTNRWYSGLVFGATPQPVFPLPLSFALTEDGFSFGLPTVTATENTIAGGHVPEVTVGVGATSAVVTSDDPSVVALDNLDAILSVEGLDAIYIGPSDLSLALGCRPVFDEVDPKAAEAIDHILARAKAHGVVAGIHNGTPEGALERVAKGFQFVTVSSDARLMASGAQQVMAKMRASAPTAASGGY